LLHWVCWYISIRQLIINKRRKRCDIISDGNLGMAGLDTVIKDTSFYQDIELATALGTFRNNPAQLQSFLQKQQASVYNDIVKQKSNTFNKVYGDLNRAAKSQESVLMYNQRNKELASVHDQVYNNQKNMATAVTNDQNLANRKNEMNEWSVGNKNDTLFVYSSLFIALSGLLLCIVLWKLGIMSASFCGSLAALLIIIFVLILMNRYQYTDISRDKRYWNRKNFSGKYGKIPVPSCPGMMDDITSGAAAVSQYAQNAQKRAMIVGENVSNVMGSVANAVQAPQVLQGAPVA
jgi:hypothetical protein